MDSRADDGDSTVGRAIRDGAAHGGCAAVANGIGHTKLASFPR